MELIFWTRRGSNNKKECGSSKDGGTNGGDANISVYDFYRFSGKLRFKLATGEGLELRVAHSEQASVCLVHFQDAFPVFTGFSKPTTRVCLMWLFQGVLPDKNFAWWYLVWEGGEGGNGIIGGNRVEGGGGAQGGDQVFGGVDGSESELIGDVGTGGGFTKDGTQTVLDGLYRTKAAESATIQAVGSRKASVCFMHLQDLLPVINPSSLGLTTRTDLRGLLLVATDFEAFGWSRTLRHGVCFYDACNWEASEAVLTVDGQTEAVGERRRTWQVDKEASVCFTHLQDSLPVINPSSFGLTTRTDLRGLLRGALQRKAFEWSGTLGQGGVSRLECIGGNDYKLSGNLQIWFGGYSSIHIAALEHFIVEIF